MSARSDMFLLRLRQREQAEGGEDCSLHSRSRCRLLCRRFTHFRRRPVSRVLVVLPSSDRNVDSAKFLAIDIKMSEVDTVSLGVSEPALQVSREHSVTGRTCRV